MKSDYDYLLEEIDDYIRNVGKNMATITRDAIYKEYIRVISAFYREYTPIYYKRHWTGGNSGGLYLSAIKYYANNHNSSFNGGITISSRNMATEGYTGGRDAALSSFLSGYHGHESLGIKSEIDTYKHMTDYRDYIKNNISRYKGVAVRMARKRHYSYLSFV